jgi:hypothetical protein
MNDVSERYNLKSDEYQFIKSFMLNRIACTHFYMWFSSVGEFGLKTFLLKDCFV